MLKYIWPSYMCVSNLGKEAMLGMVENKKRLNP